MFYDVEEMNTTTEGKTTIETELAKFSVLEAVERGSKNVLDFPCLVRKRALAWLRSDIGKYFMDRCNLLDLLQSGAHELNKYRNVGVKSGFFIWSCIDSFMKELEYENSEYYKENLKNALHFYWFHNLDYKKLLEISNFDELVEFSKSFNSSNYREEFWQKLFELAATQEQLVLIVMRAHQYPFWPEAVRRLANLKDLSPFERKR